MSIKNVHDEDTRKEIARLFQELYNFLKDNNSMRDFATKHNVVEQDGFRVGRDNFYELLESADQRTAMLTLYAECLKEFINTIDKELDLIESILTKLKKDTQKSPLDKIKEKMGFQ